MVVLAGIVQILLFFVVWRIVLTVSRRARRQLLGGSMVGDLLINLAVAIVLLITAYTIHSVWWVMIIFGAAVGVFTSQVSIRSED